MLKRPVNVLFISSTWFIIYSYIFFHGCVSFIICSRYKRTSDSFNSASEKISSTEAWVSINQVLYVIICPINFYNSIYPEVIYD